MILNNGGMLRCLVGFHDGAMDEIWNGFNFLVYILIYLILFFFNRRNNKIIINLYGGTGVRIPIIASALTISAFCQLS